MNGPGRDVHATRPSIFLRLRESDHDDAEVTWREFHSRYVPLIVGVCRRLGATDADCDDIVQDVMLGFFRVSPEFTYDPGTGRFRGYLKAATARALLRARRKSGMQTLDTGAEPTVPDAAWDQEWERSVLTRALRIASESVEPRTFEAFELTAIRDVLTSAAAARLGMSDEGVRKAKSRVSRLIRDEIERISETEG